MVVCRYTITKEFRHRIHRFVVVPAGAAVEGALAGKPDSDGVAVAAGVVLEMTVTPVVLGAEGFAVAEVVQAGNFADAGSLPPYHPQPSKPAS